MSAAIGVLSRRDLALLRATAAGRCELLCGAHPALLIDGRWCCDQRAAHALAAAGLLAPAVPGAAVGVRVSAALTPAGWAALTDDDPSGTDSVRGAAAPTGRIPRRRIPASPSRGRAHTSRPGNPVPASTRPGGPSGQNAHRVGFPNTHQE